MINNHSFPSMRQNGIASKFEKVITDVRTNCGERQIKQHWSIHKKINELFVFDEKMALL